ncbi:hypothetical protein FB45DRAFT_862793 [Roridomyces roridus]|uniref:F-box domain-containing protein n=1 Tax=Roridomyces roridus TaxID=1738132 RepID=A0AAD7FT37_9AGAR|nr:hypothetical protein FB45DRAFT_862793 [Roridomyces roridus]
MKLSRAVPDARPHFLHDPITPLVLLYCSPHDLLQLGITCTDLHVLLDENSDVWKAAYANVGVPAPPVLDKDLAGNWSHWAWADLLFGESLCIVCGRRCRGIPDSIALAFRCCSVSCRFAPVGFLIGNVSSGFVTDRLVHWTVLYASRDPFCRAVLDIASWIPSPKEHTSGSPFLPRETVLALTAEKHLEVAVWKTTVYDGIRPSHEIRQGLCFIKAVGLDRIMVGTHATKIVGLFCPGSNAHLPKHCTAIELVVGEVKPEFSVLATHRASFGAEGDTGPPPLTIRCSLCCLKLPAAVFIQHCDVVHWQQPVECMEFCTLGRKFRPPELIEHILHRSGFCPSTHSFQSDKSSGIRLPGAATTTTKVSTSTRKGRTEKRKAYGCSYAMGQQLTSVHRSRRGRNASHTKSVDKGRITQISGGDCKENISFVSRFSRAWSTLASLKPGAHDKEARRGASPSPGKLTTDYQGVARTASHPGVGGTTVVQQFCSQGRAAGRVDRKHEPRELAGARGRVGIVEEGRGKISDFDQIVNRDLSFTITFLDSSTAPPRKWHLSSPAHPETPSHLPSQFHLMPLATPQLSIPWTLTAYLLLWAIASTWQSESGGVETGREGPRY